ncbi:hypothetical protein [Rhodovulum marinum]|uniref:Uncharacterized protein n=1 Tax=Rhodovulum marinum TaxID=320662 RepID=A0A4V6NR34_9RHOB|nr:hypothetical protein [Rhodovulum marinum]TCP43966.1 hypothetical protein EV662_10151 [Rhodovulum marinum]
MSAPDRSAPVAEIAAMIEAAIESSVEDALAESARAQAEALRALENDHERNVDRATEAAFERGRRDMLDEIARADAATFRALDPLVGSRPERLRIDVSAHGDRGCGAVFVPHPAEAELFAEIAEELYRARAKFPGENVTFAALVEEVGELATSLFSEDRARVRAEAVQVAVMALRVVLDGDHTFDAWRAGRDLDPLVESSSPGPGPLMTAESLFAVAEEVGDAAAPARPGWVSIERLVDAARALYSGRGEA